MNVPSRTAMLRSAAALLMCLGTGSTVIQSKHAQAGVVGCRTDPIVTLSNGAVVHLGALIADVPTDVTGASYVVHAPAGMRVLSVVYPLDPNGIPQSFRFYADNPAGTWDSYTLVNTRSSGIAVTATADVNNVITFSARGYSRQNVHVRVVQPSGSQATSSDSTPHVRKGKHGKH